MAKRSRPSMLRGASLFADCDDGELDRIGSLLSPARVPAGTVVIQEGRPGRQFLVITEGYARVTRGTEELGQIGPGSFVGEMALLDESPRTATVTAVTALTVYALNAGEFAALLADAPSVAAKIRGAAAARRSRDNQGVAV